MSARNAARSAGVLMPIFSLPSPFGVGTLGRQAREFADFLAQAGQSYWQILPIGPTGYGDSPYQSFSSRAGNPYFIDLDELEKQGLLEREEYASLPWGDDRSGWTIRPCTACGCLCCAWPVTGCCPGALPALPGSAGPTGRGLMTMPCLWP